MDYISFWISVIIYIWCLSGIYAAISPDATVISVTPRRGSRAGGTRVTIKGTNFSKNLFNYGAKDQALGNEVSLYSGTTTYATDLHIDGCTPWQITVITRPMDVGVYAMQFLIDGVLIESNNICSECTFIVGDFNTPVVNSINPMVQSFDHLITANGKIITAFTDAATLTYNSTNDVVAMITRAYAGGDSCELFDKFGVLYGIQLFDPKGYDGEMKCRITSRNVGCYGDFSFLIEDEFGRSELAQETRWLNRIGQLCSVLIIPEITSVDYNSGGTEGGSRITLGGSNLDSSTSERPLSVTVGESICNVESVTDNEIVCVTERASPQRTVYPGSLGIQLELTEGIRQDFQSIFPDNFEPSVSKIIEKFQYMAEGGLGVGRMYGFYEPISTGFHQFHLYGNCHVKFYASVDLDDYENRDFNQDPAQKVLYVEFGRSRAVLDLKNRPHGPDMFLVQGQSYYIEVEFGCNHRRSFQLVAYRSESPFNKNKFHGAINDQQQINLNSNIVPRSQLLNLESLTNGESATSQIIQVTLSGIESDTARLCVNNACTVPLPFSISANDLEESLLLLPTVYDTANVNKQSNVYEITFDASYGNYVDMTYILPDGSSSTVEILELAEGNFENQKLILDIGGYPAVVPTDTPNAHQISNAINTAMSVQCPEFLLTEQDRFYFQNFEGEKDTTMYPEQGYRTGEVEPFCGQQSAHQSTQLYKKTAGTQTDSAIPVFTYNYVCYAFMGHLRQYIVLEYQTGPNTRKEKRNMRIHHTQADGWHYQCVNVYELLRSANQRQTEFYVTLIGVPQNAQYGNDVYIDMVSIQKYDIQYMIGRDTPIITELDLISMRAISPYILDQSTFSVDEIRNNVYNISAYSQSCRGVPQIEIKNVDQNLLHYETYSESSTGIAGTYDMHWNNEVIEGISPTLTALELQSKIELNRAFGNVQVERSGLCHNHTYSIRFNNRPGLQPDITKQSHLSGVDVTLGARHLVAGGVVYDPITLDTVARVYDQHQIRVSVNGIPARCSANCSFAWLEDDTPVVTAISHSEGSSGDELIITMTGADTENITNNYVTLGGSKGLVVTATDSEVTIIVPNAPPGAHVVKVTVIGQGESRYEDEFTYTVQPEIVAMEPETGAMGGGTLLTIEGSGFDMETTVMMGDNECLLTTQSTYSTIYCTIPPARNGIVDVIVSTAGESLVSPTQYFYSEASSPIMNSISATTASAQGGDVITILGVNFGTTWYTTRSSYIGDYVAGKGIQTDDMVELILPALPQGTHRVQLYIEEKGIAVKRDGSSFYITVEFSITSIAPHVCSTYGGCEFHINGIGLSTPDTSIYDVTIGGTTCDILEDSTNDITCFLRDSSNIRTITNKGSGSKWGYGFSWKPATLHISVNDRVFWKWESPDHVSNARYNVIQTHNESAMPDYSGFYSGRVTTAGTFSQRFTSPGMYHYTSEEVLHQNPYRLRGVIIVDPPAQKDAKLSVKVNDVEATIVGNNGETADTCGRLTDRCSYTSPDNSYTIGMLPCLAGVISDITPLRGTINTVITITGTNLPRAVNCVSIKLAGEHDCTVLRNTGNNNERTITCTLVSPSNTDLAVNEYYPLSVAIGDLGYSLFEMIEPHKRTFYLQPHVSDVNPIQGSLGGETLVTILGGGFHSDTTDTILTVTIGGFTCNVVSQSYSKIECETSPRQVESAGEVIVLVNGVLAVCESQSGICEFITSEELTPFLSSVSPARNLLGDNTMTIVGDRFSDNEDEVTVRLGNSDCSVMSASVNQIICHSESIPVGRNAASVYIAGRGRSTGTAFVNSGGRMHSVTPEIGSTEGGTQITISGNGFIVDRIDVTINGHACVVLRGTLVEIVCRTGAGLTGSYPIVLTSGGVNYPHNLMYSYSDDITPSVSSIRPASGVAGASVTIVGSGLSLSSQVMIGGSACVSDPGQSSTQIVCIVGDHEFGMLDVAVHVPGVGLARSDVTFEQLFILDDVSPNTAGHGGGILLSLAGRGFSESLNISVCDHPCTVQTVDFNELICLLPPSQSSRARLRCTVMLSSSTITETGDFAYLRDLTPIISEVTPRRGGTGGGTDVTITGSGLGSSQSDLIIDIGGIACPILALQMIQGGSVTQIVCNSGRSEKSKKTKVSVVHVVKGAALESVEKSSSFEYADVWSSRYTWGETGLKPVDKDLVLVPEGQTLLLDVDTPLLSMLLIQGGEFIFDNKDLVLRSENILITDGGLFQIGTEEEPFMHLALIEMYGRLRSPELPVYGAKTLAVRNGTLDLHGSQQPVTWTLLAESAVSGSHTLTLQTPVRWNINDMIVIATTGGHMSQEQTEQREISAISNDQRTLTLSEPLEYTHLGITESYGDDDLQLRAEVGLLTHNVRFIGKGDPSWEVDIPACPNDFNPGQFATQSCAQGRFGAEVGSDEFGAAIMGHNPEMNSGKVVMRIEHTEITYAGQAFRLGRYPIHFHVNGDMSQSYVRGCSIHRTFNRAINIHNTHNVLLQNNVVYDVKGGAIFLEDSIETGNIIEYNLVLFVHSSSSLLNDDITPAGMWITHPSNIIRHNHVAGGTHFGFWYRMLEHPEGPSHTTDICPQNALLGEFFNNTAHSTGWYGLWIFEHYFPKVGGACGSVVDEPAVFQNLIAWNCLRGGECSSCGAVQFVGFVVANNVFAGIEYLHLYPRYQGQFDLDRGPAVKDATVIAHLRYEGRPECTKRGLVLPFNSGLSVDNVRFYNFDGARSSFETNRPMTCSAIGLVKIPCQCSKICGAMTYRFSRIQWIESTHRAYPEWEHMWVLVDVDGTLTGQGANTKVVASSTMYDPELCEQNTMFSGLVDGSICAPQARFVHLVIHKSEPSESLYGTPLLVQNAHGRTRVRFHFQGSTHRQGWMMILPTSDDMLRLSFPDYPALTDFTYEAEMRDFELGDYVIIGHPLVREPIFNSLYVGDTLSLSQQQPLSYDRNDLGDWYWDEDQLTYSYIVSDKARDKDDKSRIWRYKIEGSSCSNPGDCADMEPSVTDSPEIPDSEYIELVWHNADTWSVDDGPAWYNVDGDRQTGIPQIGADVVIPREYSVTIDNETPLSLTSIKVHGRLLFLNEESLSYTMDIIYLYISGVFEAGLETEPFLGSLIINLVGDITTPVFDIIDPPLSDGTAMGAKVIGVYGTLDLHGQPHEHTWVKLSATAPSGSDLLRLSEPVDWSVGSSIVVTSTSYHFDHAEVLTITSINNNGFEITVDRDLQHTHLGSSETLPGGRTYGIRAEVGLLTHNIHIRSDDNEHSYGGRVVVGVHIVQRNDGFYDTFRGVARISGVQFSYMGQRGFTQDHDPRYSVAFVDTLDGTEEEHSYIQKCAFDQNFETVIGVYGTNGVRIVDNVVHMAFRTAIVLTGENHFISNLITRCETSGNKDFSVCVDLIETHHLSVVQGNVVTSVDRGAYAVHGELCRSQDGFTAEGWNNNEARSVMWGILMFREQCQQTGCALVRGFTLSLAQSMGMYYDDDCNLELSDMTFIDNSVSMATFVALPSIELHQYRDKYVRVSDSLFVGQSPWFDCDINKVDFASDHMQHISSGRPYFRTVDRVDGHIWGQGKSGFTTPSFLSKYLLSTSKGFIITKAYPALHGLTTLKNVFAAHFGLGCDGVKDSFISTNPLSMDVEHPIRIENFKSYDVQKESKIHIGVPNDRFINPASCGDMECDAEKKLLIHDVTGSFTDQNREAFIIPQADRAWDNPATPERGLGDYRIPAVMWTDVSGERLPVEQVKPFTGIDRPLDAEFIRQWPGYIVDDRRYLLVVFESLDADFKTRRPGPLVLRSSKGFVDVSNGPRNYKLCDGYPCNLRPAAYYVLCVIGESYDVFFTSDTPIATRIHLLNANNNDYVKFNIYYGPRHRMDVYVNSNYQLPMNAEMQEDGNIVYIPPPNGDFNHFIDLFENARVRTGLNIYNQETKTLSVAVKSDNPIVVQQSAVILVQLGFYSVDIDSFFEENLVLNIAMVLNLDPSQIRVVNAVNEDTLTRRKRSVNVRKPRAVSDQVIYHVEIGDPPQPQKEEPANDVIISDGADVDDESTFSNSTEDVISQQVNQTDSGNSPAGNSTLLTAEELVTLTHEITTVLDSGDLESNLNIEIVSHDVTEPQLPPPDTSNPEDAHSGSWIWNVNMGGAPFQLIIITQPQDCEEGVWFNTRPRIAVVDEQENIMTTISNWRIEAYLYRDDIMEEFISNESPAYVNLQYGMATFDQLAVDKMASNYSILFSVVEPREAVMSIRSDSFHSMKRELSAQFSAYCAIVNEPFDASVTMFDKASGEIAKNLDWNDQQFTCTLSVSVPQSSNFESLHSTFDLQTSRALFSNVTFTDTGRYLLTLTVSSNLSVYDFEIVTTLEVVSTNYLPPVVEHVYSVEITYLSDYQLIVDKEEEFAVMFYNDVRFDENVLVNNIMFYEGSIVTTFDVSGTNDTLAMVLEDLYSYVEGGCHTMYNDEMLACEERLVIDGEVYTPPPPTTRKTPKDKDDDNTTMVIVIVVIVLVVVIAIIIIVCCCVCKKDKDKGLGTGFDYEAEGPVHPTRGNEYSATPKKHRIDSTKC